MNTVDIHNWMDILGWTLLHSLWQGLIIGLLLLYIRRIFPSASASVKYAISTGSLLVILLAAAGTFFFLLPDSITVKNEKTTMDWAALPSDAWSIDPAAGLLALNQWVNDHLPALVNGWLIGILFFGFRLVVTWSHTVRLRIGAQPVVGFWENKLRELGCDLGISRAILLAESKWVDAPVLLGYLKPIILLPVGMISGLSPDQVETVLLHELAHIRRHDFAINFIQSVIEVIFFFNPMVWIISSQIRTDREQCCDDLVVNIKNPLTYAQALHHLAEAQTLGTALSLGVAGTENKLLQRIKRIMKTSERKEEKRGKVIPAVLVMMALTGASWLSIQAYLPERSIVPTLAKDALMLPTAIGTADTLKKDLQKERSSTYSRQSITTYDEKGEPHTEILERSEGDLDVVVPVMPPDAFIETMPELAPIPEWGELEGLNFDLSMLDTLPRTGEWQIGPDRQEWEKEFTEKFRERFSDFYDKNRPEFDKMMRELDENLKKMHENLDENMAMMLDSKRELQMREMAQALEQIAPQEEMMREQAEQVNKMKEDMRLSQESLISKLKGQKDAESLLRLRMMEQGAHLKFMQRNMKAFEKELTEQLVKDGYLGKDEKVNSINWNDDGGAITINGKKIKDSHKEKYRDLHKKFFKQGSRFGLAE